MGVITVFPFNTPCHLSKMAGDRAGLFPGVMPDSSFAEDLGDSPILTLDVGHVERAARLFQGSYSCAQADKGWEQEQGLNMPVCLMSVADRGTC